MAIVRDEQGNLRVQSGGISLPWTLGADRAQAYGLEMPPIAQGVPAPAPRMAGATAFGDSSSPGMGGGGNVPDVPVEVPGAGGSSGMGGPGSSAGGASSTQDQGGGVGAPAAPEMQHAEPSAPKAKEGAKKPDGLKGGAEEVDLPDAEPTINQRLQAARGGGQARLIPGKMQLAGYSRQVGAPKEDIERANQSASDYAEAEGQSVGTSAMAESIRNAAQAQALGQQIEHKQALVGQAEQKINQARQDYDQAQAEIDNERGKVDSLDKDPHRYFAGNGSVAKIIGLIAAAVGGGIQSGLNHSGRNPYLDGIQKLVQEDNAEWQRRKDVGRSAVNLRQKQLDARMQHFDPDTAQRELEADKLSIAAALDQKFAAQTRNAEIIAASNARVAQLKAQADAIRAENDAKLGDQITERHMMTPDRIVGGGPAGLKPEARERMVRLPDGTYGFARTSAQAKEVQDKLTPGTDIIAGLQELKQLRKEAGNVNIAPTQVSAIKQRMRAIAQGLAPRMNVRVGQGAMSEGEAKIKMQQLGDPEAVIAGEADKAIEETERMERRENDSIIRDYLTQDPEATTPVTNPGSQHRRRE